MYFLNSKFKNAKLIFKFTFLTPDDTKVTKKIKNFVTNITKH